MIDPKTAGILVQLKGEIDDSDLLSVSSVCAFADFVSRYAHALELKSLNTEDFDLALAALEAFYMLSRESEFRRLLSHAFQMAGTDFGKLYRISTVVYAMCLILPQENAKNLSLALEEGTTDVVGRVGFERIQSQMRLGNMDMSQFL